MDLPFEATKGAAENLLGVRFPVLMRVVLPGILATGVLYPSVGWALSHFASASPFSWEQIAVYAAGTFLLGALISTLNNEIYKIYEGRIFWPRVLRDWALGRQQARVGKLQKAAAAARARGDNAAYSEIWYQLRIYPLDEKGQPQAARPTRLGNILAGYEEYPNNRYGMDSVFYWPRIWLQIDKDKKEEIDSQWSLADGFLTLSAISLAGGVVWILQSLAFALGAVSFSIPLRSPGKAALASAGWLLLGYVWYRLSLPLHRENGEVFKSIFDLYRSKVWNLTHLRPNEKELWKATWAYLQYLRLKCPNCGKSNIATSDKCASCGFGLTEHRNTLRDSGKFPL
jgi:hypothetical protein